MGNEGEVLSDGTAASAVFRPGRGLASARRPQGIGGSSVPMSSGTPPLVELVLSDVLGLLSIYSSEWKSITRVLLDIGPFDQARIF